MTFGCKAYFSTDDLKEGQTIDDALLEAKDKMEQSFFESLIKGKVYYSIKEENGNFKIEGTIKLN